MKVIIFGATGMVGQGVLRECLLDSEVEKVLTLGRSRTGHQNPKLREIAHADLLELEALGSELSGYDACFFCLGVSSAGLDEDAYTRITHDIALAAGTILARLNPTMTFVFISGAGTDSTERGGTMWARVKGKTENALLKLRFKAAYMFRPGFIQPLHGITSRTKVYRIAYFFLAPLAPLAKLAFPRHVLTTEQLGRAMLKAAKQGAPKRVLEAPDIVDLAG